MSSRELGVDEHSVIKTLVMEDENKRPLIVLMHGDREVSTKNLARQIGAKTVTPCAPDVAQRHTGYMVGGTSPFGTRKALPVYMERSIADLDRLFINGGRRGFLVSLAAADLMRVLSPHWSMWPANLSVALPMRTTLQDNNGFTSTSRVAGTSRSAQRRGSHSLGPQRDQRADARRAIRRQRARQQRDDHQRNGDDAQT